MGFDPTLTDGVIMKESPGMASDPSNEYKPLLDISGDSMESPEAPKGPPKRGLNFVFALLIFLQVMMNFDSGVIAASLVEIQAAYGLGKTEAGLTGSLIYLGQAGASLVAGPLLLYCPTKWVLVGSLLLKIAMMLILGVVTDALFMLSARFLMGMSQAVVVIFAPVWVDEFAPAATCSLWMALIQAGVPVGVMIGYAVSGYATVLGASVTLPFTIQGYVLILFALLVCFVPTHHLDTRSTDLLADPKHPAKTSTLKQVSKLLRNPTYLFTMYGLCTLYFVVTGVQLWVTEYLISYVHAQKEDVITYFTVTCATGPIAGVLIGGWVLDRFGGYHGIRGVRISTRMMAGLSLFASGAAYGAIFIRRLLPVVGLLWVLLCFGGAIVPMATGTTLACVPRPARPLASSLAQLTYNLLGYFGGPTAAGILAEVMGDVQWGFWTVLGCSVFGHLFFLAAWYTAGHGHLDWMETEGQEGERRGPKGAEVSSACLLEDDGEPLPSQERKADLV